MPTWVKAIFASMADGHGRLSPVDAVEPIRVQAPSSRAAMALLADLAPLGKADLLRLDDDRWEVRLNDSTRSRICDILHAVEVWLTAWNAPETTVHISGKARVLAARPRGGRAARRGV